jgi:hypothetical protein
VHTAPAFVAWQSPVAPQWFGSMAGSTHCPSQLMKPVGQLFTHAPFAHTVPEPHCVPAFAAAQSPEAPQYRRFVWGSTQLPPQLTVPAEHSTLHAPSLHTWPVGHTAPAFAPAQSPVAPQNPRFVAGSTQLSPHAICVRGHEVAHLPALHTWPDSQAFPQAPQWRRSVCVFTHSPAQIVSQRPASTPGPVSGRAVEPSVRGAELSPVMVVASGIDASTSGVVVGGSTGSEEQATAAAARKHTPGMAFRS